MRVRRYVEDPSIGVEKVERILDAAHALSWQCRRNFAIKKLVAGRADGARRSMPRRDSADPFQKIHARKTIEVPDVHKVPLEPDEDVLLFIRDHNPFLADLEKDLLTIVDEEAKYFISHDGDEDHERRMGELLAQEDCSSRSTSSRDCISNSSSVTTRC